MTTILQYNKIYFKIVFINTTTQDILLYRSLQAISCNIEYSLQSFFPIIIPLINNL